MSHWRRGLRAGAVVATGAVTAVTVRHGLQATGPLLSVLGFFVSLAGLLYGTARPSATSPPEEQLGRSADAIATAVREQWQAGWRLRRLQDPEPLAVRRGPAPAWSADLDANVGWPPRDHQRPDVTGRLPEITSCSAMCPPAAWSSSAPPAAARPVLAVRFALDLLDRGETGGPAPVVPQASTWQPDAAVIELQPLAFEEAARFLRFLHDSEHEWMTRQDSGGLIGSALSFGILGGLGLGVAAGLAAGLHRWLGPPADTARRCAGESADGPRHGNRPLLSHHGRRGLLRALRRPVGGVELHDHDGVPADRPDHPHPVRLGPSPHHPPVALPARDGSPGG